MVNSTVTYGQLDRVLSDLGFSMKKAEEQWRFYVHLASNTVIALADEKATAPALPSDVVSARKHLIERGLITEAELDRKLSAKSR